MTYLGIGGLLALLYMLYLKIKAAVQGKKVENKKEELKEVRSESDKKVAEADISYDDLKRMLDEYYKSKK